METLLDQLPDVTRGRAPAGLGFDFMEQVDRLVEGVARATCRWMWDEMKENARGASKKIHGDITPQNAPGASLVVHHLREYIDRHGADTVAIRLVGHSAGSPSAQPYWNASRTPA